MTLVDVSHQVSSRRKRDQEVWNEARDHAKAQIASSGPQGLRERDLVSTLGDRYGLDPDIAYAIVDSLRTAGLTKKDINTGLLTLRRGRNGRSPHSSGMPATDV